MKTLRVIFASFFFMTIAQAQTAVTPAVITGLINSEIVPGIPHGILASTLNTLLNYMNDSYVPQIGFCTSQYLYYNSSGTAICVSSASSIAIGTAVSGGSVGYALYVGAGSLLAQVPYGSNVLTALQNGAGTAGGFATYNQLGSLALLNAAPAGTLTGSTLATNILYTSITGVGTITSGIWQGSSITNSYLANPSMTVAGQTCTLGNSCTISYGNLSSGAPTATSSTLGLVKPDGTTIGNAAGAISVTYGTASSTAAQGNDSRITGALQTSALGTGVQTALVIAVNGGGGVGLVNGTVPTNGHCLQWGASGITDAGGACTTGGGGGTVTSGNASQLAYYSSTGTTVVGLTAGTSGQFLVENASAVPTFVTASGDCTLAASGALTCTKASGVALTSLATTVPGTGVITALGNTANATGGVGLINGSITNGNCLKWTTSSGITDAGAACNGGSGTIAFPATVTGGTSGGIPYFSATTTLSSSALLAQNGVMYGGGAGVAPGTTTAGTTGQVLIANTSAAPSFGNVPISGTTLLTGSVGASLNLGNSNTWTAAQTFGNGNFLLAGSSSGAMTLKAPAVASSYTMTFPAATDTVAALGVANAFTGNNSHSGVETFTGALKVATRVVSASTDTASATSDYFLCVAYTSTGVVTETLPSSPPTGLTLLIKDCGGAAATHNITITPAAGTIDGASTYVMSTNYGSVAVTYANSQWSIN